MYLFCKDSNSINRTLLIKDSNHAILNINNISPLVQTIKVIILFFCFCELYCDDLY